MAQSSSTFTLLVCVTLALLLLLLLSSFSPRTPHHRNRSPRRLKLRSNFSSSPSSSIPFDPLIADLERRLEDKAWETEHFNLPNSGERKPNLTEWEDFVEAEDYINDEERFNVTGRVILLFPKIDVSPADGFISSEELTEWNLHQAARESMHRTQREMELYDKDRDGFVSFHEYEPPSWALGSHGNSDKLGWWMEDHFNASDIDGNGRLNITEFNDFLHPAESGNLKLIQWLCKVEIRERDKDGDGKLNFQEYLGGLYDSMRDYNEVFNYSDAATVVHGKKLFTQLDLDNDGFISEDELKPVIDKLHPTERTYAKQQADYVISVADSDKDGRLSLKEMIDHPYAFYSTIFSEEEEDDDYFHDEFR